MGRLLVFLAAFTFVLACRDQPFTDEPLVGPVMSPMSSGSAEINHPSSPARAAAMADALSVGAGTAVTDSKMWFDHSTAAFRAGQATGTQWDDPNVGGYSLATGANTTASGEYSTAMGAGTTASGPISTALGVATIASGNYALAVGRFTTAQAYGSTALGYYNVVSGVPDRLVSTDPLLVVGNGTRTVRSNALTLLKNGNLTIAGTLTAGDGATASGALATAIGSSAFASGRGATAIGNSLRATGDYSTALGFLTGATADRATAMGNWAEATDVGSFVYGDASAGTLRSRGSNSFTVRAAGGTVFFSNATHTTGVWLAPGGSGWNAVSDRDAKENFATEDGESVLHRIADIRIQSWNYRAQGPSIRHLGPMAQDFYAAFGLGIDDKHINTVDIDGVNLLAVQALERRTRELRQDRDRLRERIAYLEAAMGRLEAVLAALQQ